MLKIFKHLRKKDWIQVIFVIIFIVVQVWLDLKMPDYMAKITRLVQTPGTEVTNILRPGFYMLLCALGSLAAAVLTGLFIARIAASFSQKVRTELFNKVESFSLEEINKFSTASLITRSTNDVIQMQLLITMGLQMIIKAPLMVVWAISKIAGKGFEWTLATGIATGILLLTIAVIAIFTLPKFKKMQILTDNLNRVTREHLLGLRVVRAYNAEAYQENKFEKANAKLTDTQIFTGRFMAVMMPVMNLVMGGLSLAIYWIGAYLINAANFLDKLTLFSDMIVFSSYAVQVLMAFILISMIFIVMPRAVVSAKRINEVLDTYPKIVDGDDLNWNEKLSGEITFNNVSFKYPQASDYAIKNISFTAKKGETIAFIGATGSGKTTLVNLIPRFFDVTEGEILFNGLNIKKWSLENLRKKIGYVPQQAVLFTGTVSSNVAFGDNENGDISQAVQIAQAKDFVEKLEGGYDGAVAQGGLNFSGGQKQRISIARAICRKPEVFIFDDSFSALDYKTAKILRKELNEQTKGVTNFIVGQRIGTIIDADKIIVLDQGRMVGIGTHKELLKSCDIYKEIAYSQLSKEELAYG